MSLKSINNQQEQIDAAMRSADDDAKQIKQPGLFNFKSATKEPVKKGYSFSLTEDQIDKLDKIVKQQNLTNRSELLRQIIDQL